MLAPQRALQRGLHLHLAELVDGEVKVLDGLGVLVGVVVQQETCEVKSGQGHLRSGPNTDHTRGVAGARTSWNFLCPAPVVIIRRGSGK